MSGRYSRMYSAPVPKMPPGLIQLMEGLAKDVLKNSPVNIYEFCAQHMQRLIEIRDGKDETISKAHTNIRGDKYISTKNQQKKHDSDVVILKTEEDNITRKKREIIENDQSPANSLSFTDNNLENVNIKEEEPRDDEQLLKEEKCDLHSQTMVENKNSELSQSNSVTTENKSIERKENEIKASQGISEVKDEDASAGIEDKTDKLDFAEDIENVPTDEIQNSSDLDTTKVINTQSQYTRKQINDAVEKHDNETILENLEVNAKLDDISKIINYLNAEEHIDEKESNQVNNLDRPIMETTKHDNVEEKSQSIDHNNSLSSQNTSENEFYFNEGSSNVDTGTQSGINNSMDLEKAAITIQKVFRAFLFKSKTLSVDDVTNVDFNFLIENADKEETREDLVENFNKDRRSVGITRMDTVLQTVNEEKSLSLSTEDSSTLSSAATIIQAHVRGYLVRSQMPLNQTISTASVLDSDIQSATSLDGGQNPFQNKTVLNIHIVPEGSNFISRDESIITSADLSLDGSPHNSTNLHPLGYDKTERRKQLKREDAVQSVSPPSNNSGKLSEDVESIKELVLIDSYDETKLVQLDNKDSVKNYKDATEYKNIESESSVENVSNKLINVTTSDEADVVTPFTTDGMNEANNQNKNTKLMHSGEFHDIVLPTMISRNNSSVVREFQNVLVYFLLWNTS